MTFHKLNRQGKHLAKARGDIELFKAIRRLDDSDEDVSEFEAGLIESCLRIEEEKRNLTEKQRAAVEQMLERYGF